ncbi:MAG: energy transducer TonB [Terracidiphilus sp.]
MRKSTFVRTLCCSINLFCFAALGGVSLSGFAQDAAPAKDAPAATLPSDPKELMLLAAKTNGLTGDDVKPWHLKASWKLFDEKGSVKDQGTYEEYWAGPEKYKRTFTGASFTQTEYGTEKGPLVSGEQSRIPSAIDDLRNQFVNPILSSESIQRTSFAIEQREVGNLKFDCLSPIPSKEIHAGSTQCFDTGKSILRIYVSEQGEQVIHSSIAKFQGRYIAEDLKSAQQGKLVASAHIDLIELLTTTGESLFVPPPDATPKRISITVPGEVMTKMLIKRVDPEYPVYASNIGVSGNVILQATIGKDGHVADLHVISGPAELQHAALDAVKHWVYKPYLLNDDPVEVETTIMVSFKLVIQNNELQKMHIGR